MKQKTVTINVSAQKAVDILENFLRRNGLSAVVKRCEEEPITPDWARKPEFVPFQYIEFKKIKWQ